MRINRRSTRPLFGARNSHIGGCFPSLFIISVIIGMLVMSRDWIVEWLLNANVSQQSIERAQAAFARGDLGNTIKQAEELWEASPEDTESLILLARALVYNSYVDQQFEADRRRALQLTTAAYNQPLLRTRVQAIHAFALQANDRAGDATRMASAAIQRDYNNVTARVALALGYAQQGLFDQGLREARTAVELADNTESAWRMDAYRTLAIILSDMGRYGEAIAAINQAIAIHRRMIPLYFERALYAMQTSDTSSATAAYFQIIALSENNAKAHLRLCEVSIRLREREAAIEYCTQATELAPAWSEGWYQLGREYFLQGNLVQARDSLKRCTSLQTLQNMPVEERQFECWYLQGQAAEALGDCETLVPLYNQFQAMAASSNIEQTWTYPPEGPSICIQPGS
ncbi:MAG: tetratricopeptide repeat protein [Anaerolineae bacterium]|nr:tetratricopeptide repeat protein [Anaerolineae bacterium]